VGGPRSTGVGYVPEEAAGTLGRATGVEDRGQRSIVAYDERGNAIWTARQMAIIPTASGLATAPGSGNYPDVTETAPFGADVTYDTAHLYEQSSEYDYANRGRRLLLPIDPDFGGAGIAGPEVRGELRLDARGLAIGASAYLDTEEIPVLSLVDYEVHGLAMVREYGPSGAPVLTETFGYDNRLRPTSHMALRSSTSGTSAGEIGYVTEVANEHLTWDPASNLKGIAPCWRFLRGSACTRRSSLSIYARASTHSRSRCARSSDMTRSRARCSTSTISASIVRRASCGCRAVGASSTSDEGRGTSIFRGRCRLEMARSRSRSLDEAQYEGVRRHRIGMTPLRVALAAVVWLAMTRDRRAVHARFVGATPRD
jgi:hypothetical protein